MMILNLRSSEKQMPRNEEIKLEPSIPKPSTEAYKVPEYIPKRKIEQPLTHNEFVERMRLKNNEPKHEEEKRHMDNVPRQGYQYGIREVEIPQNIYTYLVLID